MSNPNIGFETYFDIHIAGIKASCLIDTGCDHSILRVKTTTLTPVTIDLYALHTHSHFGKSSFGV